MIIIKNKKLLLSISVFFIAFLFTGCFTSLLTIDEAKLTSIEVLPSNMTVEVGKTKAITSVTALYDNGTEASLVLTACTYESNKTNVTVANGVIKVLPSCTAGTTATIIVSYTEGGVTEDATVIVTVPAPASGG